MVSISVWAVDWQIEEEEILDTGKDVQHDEDIVSERKGEGNRSRDTKECKQRGFKDKRGEEEGTREEEEWPKVRKGQEQSKIHEELTKKGRQRCS